LFLAKRCLAQGLLAEAVQLRRGIDLNPNGEFAPLGHFVIADVYTRQGARQMPRAKLPKDVEWRRARRSGD
jgi:hypothetical protein